MSLPIQEITEGFSPKGKLLFRLTTSIPLLRHYIMFRENPLREFGFDRAKVRIPGRSRVYLGMWMHDHSLTASSPNVQRKEQRAHTTPISSSKTQNIDS